MIASEAVEPGHGWDWSAVIDSYDREDSIVEAGKRMVDDFVENPDQDHSDTPRTLSLLDLSRFYELEAALDSVVSDLDEDLLDDLEYTDALIHGTFSAESYGFSEKGDSRLSIDLFHFAQLMAEQLPDTELGANLDDLMDAVESFVRYSYHDGSKPDSSGVAIAAPENADPEYDGYKINDTWLDFQDSYQEFLHSDLEPPEIIGEYTDSDGTLSTKLDKIKNLSPQVQVGPVIGSWRSYPQAAPIAGRVSRA